MKTRLGLVAAATAISILVGTAWAGRGLGSVLLAYPGYDTRWTKQEGVPDDSRSRQGLVMRKVVAAEETNGSEAMITGVEGTVVTKIGFDVRDDGLCGSALVFRVRWRDAAGAKTLSTFTCESGTLVLPSPENWKRVRFYPLSPGPGFVVDDLRVIFKLPGGIAGTTGYTVVDNLDVNGTLIGESGGGKRDRA